MAVVLDEMFEIVFRGEADFKIPLIRSVFHRQVFRQTVDSSVLQNYSRRGWPCQLSVREGSWPFEHENESAVWRIFPSRKLSTLVLARTKSSHFAVGVILDTFSSSRE